MDKIFTGLENAFAGLGWVWKPQKSKDQIFLHRNYAQFFFSTPKKIYFFSRSKKFSKKFPAKKKITKKFPKNPKIFSDFEISKFEIFEISKSENFRDFSGKFS